MCPLVLCICNFFIPTVTECVIDGVTYNIGDNVPNDDLCLPWYVALFTGSLNSGPLDYLQGPFAVCFDSINMYAFTVAYMALNSQRCTGLQCIISSSCI